MEKKRYCKVCDANTKQRVVYSDSDLSKTFWKCGNCGNEVARRKRSTKHMREIDETFAKLLRKQDL